MQSKKGRISPRLRRNILVGVLATLALVLAFLAAAWSSACAGNTCPSIDELGSYDPNQELYRVGQDAIERRKSVE